jgi:DNA invertase Pin-like site-specific DNA recombinase
MENKENNKITKPRIKIRVGKYKRCSSASQDKEMILQEESLQTCLKRLREDNPDKEYVVFDFDDYAISGKTTERKALIRMMEKINNNKIDLIIFTKLDRLARSLQDLLNITSQLENKNVKFIVVEQNIDTTTYQGRLLFQIIGAFSEFERNIIRERMDTGRKRAELVGTKSGKPCHRPKLKIDEDGVRFKYQKGMSMQSIAKEYGISITPIRRVLSKEIEDNKRKEFEKLKEKFKE